MGFWGSTSVNFPKPPLYLYIDGNYVLSEYSRVWQAVYGEPGELDFVLLKAGVEATKAFFYDAVIEPKPLPDGASEEERAKHGRDVAKNAERLALYDGIQRLSGYHVRTGTSVKRHGKGKPIEQKEVDVLLAVEALTHAFRGNTGRVALLTGDLDFRPLVNALVDMGQDVTVIAAPLGSSGLMDASDNYRELTFADLYAWTTEEARSKVPKIVVVPRHKSPRLMFSARGSVGGEQVMLGPFAHPDVGEMFRANNDLQGEPFIATCPSWPMVVGCAKIEPLKRYLTLYKNVQWE